MKLWKKRKREINIKQEKKRKEGKKKTNVV